MESVQEISTQLRIRTFTFPDDYPAVFSLWEESGPGVQTGRSDTLEEIEKKVQRDPDLFLVAELDGQLIGSVLGGFDGRRGIIYHLAVAKEFRQLGIGSLLMDEVEERLRSKGCLRSYLLVIKENQSAANFYKKRGWAPMDYLDIFGKNLA